VHAVCCKEQNFVVLKKVAGLHCLLHACTGWYNTATLELSAMPALLAGTLRASGAGCGCGCIIPMPSARQLSHHPHSTSQAKLVVSRGFFLLILYALCFGDNY